MESAGGRFNSTEQLGTLVTVGRKEADILRLSCVQDESAWAPLIYLGCSISKLLLNWLCRKQFSASVHSAKAVSREVLWVRKEG